MNQFEIIRIYKLKILFSSKTIFKEEKIFPYKINKLGHAKAIARIMNADVKYHDKNNNIINVVVKDSEGKIVFSARQHINGIIGNNLLDEV